MLWLNRVFSKILRSSQWNESNYVCKKRKCARLSPNLLYVSIVGFEVLDFGYLKKTFFQRFLVCSSLSKSSNAHPNCFFSHSLPHNYFLIFYSPISLFEPKWFSIYHTSFLHSKYWWEINSLVYAYWDAIQSAQYGNHYVQQSCVSKNYKRIDLRGACVDRKGCMWKMQWSSHCNSKTHPTSKFLILAILSPKI